MNLLTSKWIPIESDYTTLEDILCGKATYKVMSKRDDFEFAMIQLLICIVQSIFLPNNYEELEKLRDKPISQKHYRKAIKTYLQWFDINHPTHPFMQIRDLKRDDPTKIQKLFAGLPAGTSHTFWDSNNAIQQVCAGCAAIALFNQANNAPSFGGGYLNSIRGRAPITCFVGGNNLRETIWNNIIPAIKLEKAMPGFQYRNNAPVWVDLPEKDETVNSEQIGLLRGLFWQPAHIELKPGSPGCCDFCDCNASILYSGFKMKRFRYFLNGLWPHPHSPCVTIEGKKDADNTKFFMSFNQITPAWSHFSQFLFPTSLNESISEPALVVSSFEKKCGNQPLQLMIGGYSTNQSLVTGRRHELFQFLSGWTDMENKFKSFVNFLFEIKKTFTGVVFFLAQDLNRIPKQKIEDFYKSTFGQRLQREFYTQTEPLVMRYFANPHDQDLVKKFLPVIQKLFDERFRPYERNPSWLKRIVPARFNLRMGLSKKLNMYQKGELGV